MISLGCLYFKAKKLVARLARKQDGISAIEYGFLAVAISVSLLFIFSKNGSISAMHEVVWQAMGTLIDNVFAKSS